MDSKVDNVEQLLSRALSLSAKFEQCSETRYMDEAIVFDREALDACTLDHPRRSSCLIVLSWHIWIRFEQLGGIENISEAILHGQEALALCPPGNPLRSLSLHNLGVYLWSRYSQRGRIDDINEAIALGREALALRPPGHPDRHKSLNQLANYLWGRYNQLGGIDNINETIVLGREALALRSPGHPDRSVSLDNLSLYLCARYDQLGQVDDLDEAIRLNEDALVLRPPGHLDRPKSLSSLAVHLWTRYRKFGRVGDLDEAIRLDRDALSLCPSEHKLQPMYLNNLAIHLSTRYKQLYGVEDLEEAIFLDRDALKLCPPGHPDRSSPLNNLANHLWARHNLLDRMDDLDEAICLDQEALKLRPPGHPDRSLSLNNLALHLWSRYSQLDGLEDLDEVICLDREALALCPPGHPGRSSCLSNLAFHLSGRYNRLGGVENLNEAIRLNRGALALRPTGHPDRATTLHNLAACLCSRYKQLYEAADQEEAFRLFTELGHGVQTVSSNGLFAAKGWISAAEEFRHPTMLLAYETTLRLLVHQLAVLPSLPQHLSILKILTSSLAVDAFSACLRSQSLTKAVELFEQGRGVFWSQLTRLRLPVDIIESGPEGKTLADDFTRLASLVRNALDSPGADQHDRVCRLNLELERVVSDIRKLPGHSRFLLPLLFSDLRHAASGGPVIIVNASKYTCDALVVFVDRDPVHIPLSITKETIRELSSKLQTLTERAKKLDVTKGLGIFLRELWERVVSPIVDLLQTTHPRYSRIWWCPTAEFTLLPLHAAGPYRKGQKNLSHLYISSYTPTLSALIRSRQHHHLTNPVGEQKRFLGIGQAKASGANELFSVATELANIGQCINGIATFTCIESEESCVSRVIEELTRNQWVHLACHGFANKKQVFESAFALHDGHLTIQRIIGCDLQDPEFAYLSACHTTVGDEDSPDEVIHLASAMQFAGFRSVIGTMWSVDDAETNKIIPVFYKHMVDKLGCLDHTRAAYALWRTMKSVDIPLDQRILYIHLGA